MTRPGTALLHAIPFLGCLVVAGSAVVYADRLPDELAIHWSGATADGFGSLELLVLLNGALVLALGFGFLAAARSAPTSTTGRSLAAGSAGMTGFLVVLHVVTVRASMDVVDPATVPFPAWGLGLALLVGGALAALGWVVGPRGSGTPPTELAVEELAVEPGEAVVWSGRARPERWVLALPVIAALGGFVLGVAGEWAAGAVLLGAALLTLSLLWVRVTIGPAGLTATLGPLPVFRTRVALEEVADVRAERVEPMRYGGWGYRVTPGVRALVVRCGEGIHVSRHDGPDLVVTVDGAPRAAGVLRAHLDALARNG